MRSQIAPPSTLSHNKVTVTTAGTRVQLGTVNVVSVTITALSANAGVIYVGSSIVAAANGYQLQPGNSVSLDISSLGVIWIDSAVNGDSVTYIGIL